MRRTRPFRRRSVPVAVAALLAAALAAGCARKAPPSPPPVAVEVVPVVQRDVPILGEWIGTLDGSVNADIRPKIEGYVLREFYKEGQFVHRNDPLFEIDPRQFRAVLEQELGNALAAERDGKGAVAAARAALDQAALNLGWTKILSPIDGIAGIARTQ